ncbi:MAG: ABC transporter ATP-binding protein [Candidatus Eremiobacteraeota bacterium]|nr:ABC transporter ATP-binding protein [Candidatus Eremiobacteraeota bacterium]
MIAARRLEIRIAGRVLLADANFTIESGEFVAVLGRNGVGKTTLLRTLCGLHADYTGEIHIDGKPLGQFSSSERARRIAYVASDEMMLEMLTVRDVVANGRYAYHGWFNWHETPEDTRAIASALDAVAIEELAHRLFTTLSSGERQRCWLALALAQEPRVMLLDEPTTHLDVRVAQDILRLLHLQRAAGRTLVCVFHELNEALAFADRIFVLGDGTLLSTASARDYTDGHTFERAYGLPMESIRLSDGSMRVFPRPSANSK